MIDLDKMFESFDTLGAFIRVGVEYKNDIYVGYSQNNNKAIVVIGNSKQKHIKSTSCINALISERHDGRVALEFSLLSDMYYSVFLKFCEDIVANSVGVSSDRVIAHTIARWKTWQALFEKKHNDILCKESIKGLVGELIFIRYFLIPKFGELLAIESWVGPEGNPKDFVLGDTWFEIKTILESKKSVQISSLEQLDSDDVGHMIVNRIQNSNVTQKGHISLNNIVLSLYQFIQDNKILELFARKLYHYGYQYDKNYDEICFEYKDSVFFKVDEQFPTIKKNIIPTGILRLSYELSLVILEKERVEKWI